MEDQKRDARARRSAARILEAVHQIMLTEGAGAVTHQRVAEIAGVGRATVYRHWSTKEEMIGAVIERFPMPFLEDESGPLPERLFRSLRHLADSLSDPAVWAIAATIIANARTDPSAGAVRDRLAQETMRNIDLALSAGADTGESLGDIDPTDLGALLIGPIWLRIFIEDRAVTDTFIQQVIRTALTAHDISTEH